MVYRGKKVFLILFCLISSLDVLMMYGANSHSQIPNQKLKEAIGKEDLEQVKQLLGKNVDVDFKDDVNALFVDVLNRKDVKEKLRADFSWQINEKGNVYIENEDGTCGDVELSFNLLHYAALVGNLDLVKMLVGIGVDVNVNADVANESEITPLNLCASFVYEIGSFNQNRKEVVEFLVEQGAKIDVEDIGGFTPIADLASALCDEDVILSEKEKKLAKSIFDFLIKRGADINKKNQYGYSPLREAAFAGNNTLVNFLIENGANTDDVNDFNLSNLSN